MKEITVANASRWEKYLFPEKSESTKTKNFAVHWHRFIYAILHFERINEKKIIVSMGGRRCAGKNEQLKKLFNRAILSYNGHNKKPLSEPLIQAQPQADQTTTETTRVKQDILPPKPTTDAPPPERPTTETPPPIKPGKEEVDTPSPPPKPTVHTSPPPKPGKEEVVPSYSLDLPEKYRVSEEDIQKDEISFHGFNRMMKDQYLDVALREMYDADPKICIGPLLRDPLEYGDQYEEGKKQEQMDAYAKQQKKSIEELLEKKSEAKWVFLPCLKSGHYTGIAWDQKENRIYHYNSQPHDTLTSWETTVENFIRNDFSGQSIPEIVTNTTCPQQGEPWSCGYRQLDFFQRLAGGELFSTIDNAPPSGERLAQLANDYMLVLVKKQQTIPDSDSIFIMMSIEGKPIDEISTQFKNKIDSLYDNRADKDLESSLFSILIYVGTKNEVPQLVKCLKEKGGLTKNKEQLLSSIFSQKRNDYEGLIDTFENAFRAEFGHALGSQT